MKLRRRRLVSKTTYAYNSQTIYLGCVHCPIIPRANLPQVVSVSRQKNDWPRAILFSDFNFYTVLCSTLTNLVTDVQFKISSIYDPFSYFYLSKWGHGSQA